MLLSQQQASNVIAFIRTNKRDSQQTSIWAYLVRRRVHNGQTPRSLRDDDDDDNDGLAIRRTRPPADEIPTMTSLIMYATGTSFFREL